MNLLFLLTMSRLGVEVITNILYRQYDALRIVQNPGSVYSRYWEVDVALIQVREAFGNPSNAFRPTPIGLPQGEIPQVGATCYVAGYGSAAYGSRPLQRLMEVNF